jgi:hypothetical protein
VFLATDRVHVLRKVNISCRKGGTVSVPGFYVGMGDKLPIGPAMNKGLTIKLGQTHFQGSTTVAREDRPDAIDPSFVVTHPASLEDTPELYARFGDKDEGVIKVLMRPARLICLSIVDRLRPLSTGLDGWNIDPISDAHCLWTNPPDRPLIQLPSIRRLLMR